MIVLDRYILKQKFNFSYHKHIIIEKYKKSKLK